MSEVTQILQAIEQGMGGLLTNCWRRYEELRQLAARKLPREKPGQTVPVKRRSDRLVAAKFGVSAL